MGAMRDLAVLFLHLLATVARLAGPGGARAVVAESVLVKQQLLILNRSRKRSPNLRLADRLVAGVCTLLIRPSRLVRSAIVLKPSTLLRLRRALIRRKYRRLFSSTVPTKPGPKGPSQEVIAAVVDMKRRNPTWLCQERARGARCCTGDEGGPFGAGFQEQASNSRELLPSNGGGGERSRKRRDSRVMCGLERRAQANHRQRPRKDFTTGIKTGASQVLREEHGGYLVTGHAVSGVQVA